MAHRKLCERYVIVRRNAGNRNIEVYLEVNFEKGHKTITLTPDHLFEKDGDDTDKFVFIDSDPALAAKVINAMGEAVRLANRIEA